MVKNTIIIFIIFLLCWPAYAQEAVFSASIDRTDIAVGDKFEVKFTLQNAEAYSTPDTSKFPESFEILSQSQQQNLAIINGNRIKSRSWIYKVKSERPGNFTIPKISIRTNNGKVSANQVYLDIKSTSDIPSVTLDKEIFIESKVDKVKPFIDEPIIYQTRVYHQAELGSAELVKPSSDSAVIEQITEPKTGVNTLNGTEYNTIEVNYLVTPIRSGKVEIEPSILRGEVFKAEQMQEKTSFDNFFDPFALLSGTSPTEGPKKLVPFTVASNKIELDVKPANEAVSPWLALYDLQISAEVTSINKTNNNYVSKLGEPITLDVIFNAVGKSGNLLPDVETNIKSDDFKIYADKPITKRRTLESGNSFAEKINGLKKQSLTLIPKKSGKLIIPEIKITYWNLKEDKVATASTNNIEVYITKAADIKSDISENNISHNQNLDKQLKKSDQIDGKSNSSSRLNKFISVTIGILVFLIFALLLKLANMKKQIEEKNSQIKSGKKADKNSKKTSSKTSSNKKLKENTTKRLKKIEDDNSYKSVTKDPKDYTYDKNIEDAEDAKDLLKILQDFAYRILNMPKDTAGVIIAQNISRKYKLQDYNLTKAASQIDGAIYLERDIELSEVKETLKNSFAKIQSKINEKSKNNFIPSLNPE